MRGLLESFHGIMMRTQMSAEELAEASFGFNSNGRPCKSHWTLYKELNPDDDTAKLGLIDAIRLMEVSGDIEPLYLIADRLGCMLRRKDNVQPDCSNWEKQHVQTTVFLGKMSHLMEEGAAPNTIQATMESIIQNLEKTALLYSKDYNTINSGTQKIKANPPDTAEELAMR